MIFNQYFFKVKTCPSFDVHDDDSPITVVTQTKKCSLKFNN